MKRSLALTLALLPATVVFGHEDDHWGELPPDPINGWYTGGGLLRSEIYTSTWGGDKVDSSNNDMGFIINGGYRIDRNWAIELGYIDGGDMHFSDDIYTDDLYLETAQANADISVQAIEASGLFIWPFLPGFEVYGRLGAAFWEGESQQSLVPDDGGPVLRQTLDESGTGLLIGLGLGMDIGDNWHLRAEIQDFDIGNNLLSESDDAELHFESWVIELQYRYGDSWNGKPSARLERPEKRKLLGSDPHL